MLRIQYFIKKLNIYMYIYNTNINVYFKYNLWLLLVIYLQHQSKINKRKLRKKNFPESIKFLENFYRYKRNHVFPGNRHPANETHACRYFSEEIEIKKRLRVALFEEAL